MEQNDNQHEFFAASVSGCEKVLCEELRELNLNSVRLNLGGGIPFRGTWEDGWRACLQSRIAQRIQKVMKRFPAPTPEALYEGVQSIDWAPYITSRQTLAVKSVCVSSQINHSGFAALKVKDAIVDQVRSREGKRPSVSTDDPDVRIFLYLVADKATIYIDLSGEPLHMRGYRTETGAAPLRETVAAALLRMAEWDCNTPLIDPMCGSGTIPIEAAMRAADIPPGLTRSVFGFERWANFDADKHNAFRELCGQLRGNRGNRNVRIQGLDKDERVLDKAQRNARAAGVKIAFKQRSVFDLHPDGKSRLLITNPPYGVRLQQEPDFPSKAAARFRKLHGWRVCILTERETDQFAEAMSMKPAKTFDLLNGSLECKFLVYDIE